MVIKTAIITHDTYASYTGTCVPINYKFLCFVGDTGEAKLVKKAYDSGKDCITVDIDIPEKVT